MKVDTSEIIEYQLTLTVQELEHLEIICVRYLSNGNHTLADNRTRTFCQYFLDTLDLIKPDETTSLQNIS